MKLCIGVDFDNTIACYDQVFAQVAETQGMIRDIPAQSKIDVKNKILSDVDGDFKWQVLQGQIYGKYMHMASVFPGFAEFLHLAKLKGHDIYIISHKSEFGHFDKEKVHLRAEAMKWLVANRFVGQGESMLSEDAIFFEPTRESKIEKIIELRCTHFIDDLQEVFDEASFPCDINKYLFSPQIIQNDVTCTWRSITRHILGDWTDEAINLAVQGLFPDLSIQKAELKRGRGNSKIYKLIAEDGKEYALKVYPDIQTDKRKRLETEFFACHMLGQMGFSVPYAVVKDENMNWGVYFWIDGSIEAPDVEFIEKSIEFIQRLKVLSQTSDSFKAFSNASESCISGSEIVKQIRNRFDQLCEVDSKQLKIFLLDEFLLLFEFLIQYAMEYMEDAFNKSLDSSLLIAGPSDFGAHNALKNKAGKTFFIDFEYFGWDDPVKLVCDFYWHPGMNLSEDLKAKWLQETKIIFAGDINFETRVTAYLPLFGVRWCLILLNEFLPNKLIQRIHADQKKGFDTSKILREQLDKSQNLLNNIKGLVLI